MITMEKINSMWSAIVPQKGSTIARRADPAHPLDFFIGYDENGYMQLMLISDEEPKLPDSSQQVLVRRNQRTDGQYAICFSLINTSLREIFVSLCWDIMESTYGASNKKDGAASAIRRFGMWQVLLAKGTESKMSDLAVRGLIGELSVLKNFGIPRYGKSHAVTGWIGPLRADRDFEYEDTWFEVKAASLSKESIIVSSLDQLDIDRPGNLIVCRLEKTSEADPNALTLNTLVKAIEEDLGEDEYALSTLHVRLTLSGYDETDERIDDPFVVNSFEVYRVEDDFPRIRRSQLHSAIGSGEYALNISALQPWRTK